MLLLLLMVVEVITTMMWPMIMYESIILENLNDMSSIIVSMATAVDSINVCGEFNCATAIV
jgi:hypothetical protein